MFKIGQEVVCIDDSNRDGRIKEGECYTVLQHEVCKCGEQSIDVGSKSFLSGTGCFKCHHIFGPALRDGILWHCSKRFAPLEEWEQAESLVEEIKEQILEPELI